ncbi:tail fiber assembly protein [Aeromonas veronii]|uniref:tail fiber assembly protein n=1 Tax=Aeromonas TaxID=642 RepID=UPI0022EA4E8E|nr:MULTISPECIES: tail fiber assembly protein [Aeromonas]KAJ8740052.1 tail fiber assembly protein [Aeromonas veronii]MDA3317870.1 tail fiber assembly protein [Aeromonas sp. PI_26]
MNIITAKNVMTRTNQPDSLDMEVLFSHQPDRFIPFTAKRDDSAAHGRELYMRAMFGEFGEISTKEKNESQQNEAEKRYKLEQLITDATVRIAPLQDAKELGLATPEELTRLEALQRYRIALMRLPESEGWPTAVTWPELPQ